MALEYEHDIIEFVEKYDINPSTIPVVIRYQELKLKELRTPNEEEELNLLANTLERYLITATDYNKLFQAVKNVQKFVTMDLKDYVNNLFDQYDKRMENMEDEFEMRKHEIDSWYSNIKMEIFDAQYFDFDNDTYRGGHIRRVEKTNNNKYTITIVNKENGETFAIRVVEKVGSDWITTTVCGSLNVNYTKKSIKKSSDIWETEIVDNTTYLSEL